MTPFPIKSVIRITEPTPNHLHAFFVAQRNTETMADDSRQQAFCLTSRCSDFRYVGKSNARLATTEELHGLIRATIHEARKGLLGIDSEVSTSLDPDPEKLNSAMRQVKDRIGRLEILVNSQRINLLAAILA